jgi:predicted ATPase
MDPELLRLKGELLIALDPGAKADAEVAFCQAIDIAQRQSSKSWELRAATSMARLWRDQGKRGEARELLAPVYGWFTEGFDTLDLKKAGALLEQLGDMSRVSGVTSARRYLLRNLSGTRRVAPTMAKSLFAPSAVALSVRKDDRC